MSIERIKTLFARRRVLRQEMIAIEQELHQLKGLELQPMHKSVCLSVVAANKPLTLGEIQQRCQNYSFDGVTNVVTQLFQWGYLTRTGTVRWYQYSASAVAHELVLGKAPPAEVREVTPYSL